MYIISINHYLHLLIVLVAEYVPEKIRLGECYSSGNLHQGPNANNGETPTLVLTGTWSGRNCNVPKWSTFGLPFHVKLDGAGMVSSHWGGVVLYPTPSTGRCSTSFKTGSDI